MRGCVGLVAVALVACGAGGPRAVELPDASSPIAEETPSPWGLVRVRPCGPRGGFGVVVTDAHVHGCDAVFTRDGALVTAEPLAHSPRVLGSAGGRLLVQLSEWVDDAYVMDLALLDTDLRRVGERMAFEYVQAAASGSGSEVLLSTPSAVSRLDLATGTLRALDDRCAGADALGLVEGGVACVVWSENGTIWLRAPGRADRALPAFTVFEFAEEWLVGMNAEGLLVIDLDGDTRRLVFDRARLLDVRDERALISSSAGVALVDLHTLALEEVLPTQADDGAFAGEELIVESQGALLWLARGATHVRPSLEMPTPTGLVPLDEVPGRQWGDQERALPWSYGDVAAFVSPEGADDEHAVEVIVSASEASELAAFDDAAAWARALFGRYVPRGQEVWVRVWRDEAGHRVMRAHAWIGGCARTHYDVRVRELGERTERYEVRTTQRGHARADEILGRVPASAYRVLDEPGAFAGDPSMGEP